MATDTNVWITVGVVSDEEAAILDTLQAACDGHPCPAQLQQLVNDYAKVYAGQHLSAAA